MTVRGNEWGGELRNSTGAGVALTPGNNVYPTPVEVLGAAVWPTTTRADDAFAIEINLNNSTVSTASKDLKVNLYWVITYTDAGVVIDAAADTIKFPNAHGLATTDICTFTTTGVITAGLNTTTDWHIIRVDETTVAFALTEADARANIRRSLNTGGSGTQTLTCRKIQHLSGSEATALVGNTTGGHTYYFPLYVPAGMVIHASASVNNVTVGTVNCLIRLLTFPSKLWALRVGTFVRTLGAVPATSAGTAIVPTNGTKSAWVDLGAMSDPLWYWNFGVGFDNAAYPNNNTLALDLAVGEATFERVVLRDVLVLPSNVETLGTPVGQRHNAGHAVATENAFIRMLSNGVPGTGWSVLAYGVGGKYVSDVVRTVAGTVTINGASAPGGETVQVFAYDVDGGASVVGEATTAVGGAFSLSVPTDTRTYFASYAVGGGDPAGRSFDGNPSSATFNIIAGSGGGETVPPSASATFPSGAEYAVVRDGVVTIPIVDASSSVGLVAISVRFPNASTSETIYMGNGSPAGFAPGYRLASSISGSGLAGVGYTFTIRRDASWPRGQGATFTVRAADTKGNVLL